MLYAQTRRANTIMFTLKLRSILTYLLPLIIFSIVHGIAEALLGKIMHYLGVLQRIPDYLTRTSFLVSNNP